MTAFRRRTAWIAALFIATASAAWLALAPAVPDAGDDPGDDEARGSRLFAEAPTQLVLTTAQARCRYLMRGAWERGCAEAPLSPAPEAAQRIAMAARMRAEREFAVPSSRLAEFGLDAPLLTVAGETPAGPLTLRFGALAPDALSRYAHWVERDLTITVPDFHFRNLAELLADGNPGR